MSQRILVDINVLMDVLVQRQPYYVASAAAWEAVASREVVGWVSANSITTLYYLLRKSSGHTTAMQGIRLVHKLFSIAPVDAALIEKALNSPVNDLEDAVQYESALLVNATTIVTRDEHHFRDTTIPIVSPEFFVANLNPKYNR